MPIRVVQPDGSIKTVLMPKSKPVVVEPPVVVAPPVQRRDITPAWRTALGTSVEGSGWSNSCVAVAAPVVAPVAKPLWRPHTEILDQVFGDHSIYNKNDRKNEHNILKFVYSMDKSLFSISDIHSSYSDRPHYSIRVKLGIGFVTYHAYPFAANQAKIEKVTGFSVGVSYILVERN